MLEDAASSRMFLMRMSPSPRSPGSFHWRTNVLDTEIGVRCVLMAVGCRRFEASAGSVGVGVCLPTYTGAHTAAHTFLRNCRSLSSAPCVCADPSPAACPLQPAACVPRSLHSNVEKPAAQAGSAAPLVRLRRRSRERRPVLGPWGP